MTPLHFVSWLTTNDEAKVRSEARSVSGVPLNDATPLRFVAHYKPWGEPRVKRKAKRRRIEIG